MDKVKVLTIVLFIVALVEVIAEYFRSVPLIYILKPSISIVLMFLYWYSSPKKDILFFLTISTSLITNVLFIPNNIKFIFLGLIVFGFHRLINIFYILKVMSTKDFIPVILGSVPFLFIFFYIFFDNDLLTKEVY